MFGNNYELFSQLRSMIKCRGKVQMVLKMFNNSSNLSVTVPFKELPWEAINLHRCSYSWMNTENSSSEMFPPRAVCPLLCKIFALLRVSWVSENTVRRGSLVSALARSCGSQGVSVCINQELAPHITQELRSFKKWEKSKTEI